MIEWQNRPLDQVYPVLFIDAIVVKVRDGQVTNRPVYAVIGVSVNGERDILGLWAGDGGEGAKFWLGVLTEIKNRGVQDVCIVVCDGLKGLPDVDHHDLAARDGADLHHPPDPQHLPVRFPRRTGTKIARDLRPVYTRGQRGDGRSQVRGVQRGLGQQVPGDHDGCGTTPGTSSSRSWTTTSRSGG